MGAARKKTCPDPACANEDFTKIMYLGFPMKFCQRCTNIWGLWSFLPMWFGFNGVLFMYTGGYWKGLWHYLTMKEPT